MPLNRYIGVSRSALIERAERFTLTGSREEEREEQTDRGRGLQNALGVSQTCSQQKVEQEAKWNGRSCNRCGARR